MTFEQTILERFVCLDVDRTILKSTTFAEAYVYPALVQIYSADNYPAAPEAMRVIEAVQIEERRNRGRAFDYLAVYAEYMEQQGWQPARYTQVADVIIAQARDASGRISEQFIDDILVAGTLELIKTLQSRTPWGFLTTGGQQTQRLKLTVIAAILQQELSITPRGMVIASEQKAEMINTVWRDPQVAGFRVPLELLEPAQVARRVVMIDDKPKNLRHEGADIETFLVHAAEVPPADDEGFGPRRSLREVAQAIAS